MKQYFAKYVPVEGEIKEGDWKFCSNYNELHHYGVGKGIEQDTICKECKKVKLFLCSRDIKVGDNVQYQGEDWGVPITVSDHMRLTKWIKGGDETIFKVIGEISSDAVWATEGMEFDEKDLLLTYSPLNFENKPNIRTIFKVKCGQCQTYH